MTESLAQQPQFAPSGPILEAEECNDSSDITPGSLRGKIKGFMEEKGGLVSHKELVEAFSPNVPLGSIGAICLAVSTRVAPGLFALPEHVLFNQGDEVSSERLLGIRDCRAYITAKNSGEGFGLYPLWTPSMERTWCHWAKTNASSGNRERQLFESLLSVIEPEAWARNEVELKHWKHRQETQGRYRYGQRRRHKLDEHIPNLKSVLRVALATVSKKRSGWVTANRFAGLRLDIHGGASYLAVLLGMGLIRTKNAWHENHVICSENVDWVGDLILEQLHKGQLQWSGVTGNRILDTLERGAKDAEASSWIEDGELAELVVAIRSGTITRGFGRQTTSSSQAEDGDGTDVLEDPFERLARMAREERAARLLAEGVGPQTR